MCIYIYIYISCMGLFKKMHLHWRCDWQDAAVALYLHMREQTKKNSKKTSRGM